jgi:hypothetical protein
VCEQRKTIARETGNFILPAFPGLLVKDGHLATKYDGGVVRVRQTLRRQIGQRDDVKVRNDSTRKFLATLAPD